MGFWELTPACQNRLYTLSLHGWCLASRSETAYQWYRSSRWGVRHAPLLQHRCKGGLPGLHHAPADAPAVDVAHYHDGFPALTLHRRLAEPEDDRARVRHVNRVVQVIDSPREKQMLALGERGV